jgi:hypothetical protein
VEQLAHDPALQQEAWRVLVLLLSTLGDDQRILVLPTAQARVLQVPRQNIWRALTTLARAQCVARVAPGLPATYQVSPLLASRWHEDPRARAPKPAYVRFWQTAAWRALAADRALHGSHFRVLGKVLACLGWSNRVSAPPRVWGAQLGIARQTVSRALEALLARGVLVSDWRGRPDHYVLSFAYAYRGARRHLPLLRRQQQAQVALTRLALAQGESAEGLSRARRRGGIKAQGHTVPLGGLLWRW